MVVVLRGWWVRREVRNRSSSSSHSIVDKVATAGMRIVVGVGVEGLGRSTKYEVASGGDGDGGRLVLVLDCRSWKQEAVVVGANIILLLVLLDPTPSQSLDVILIIPGVQLLLL